MRKRSSLYWAQTFSRKETFTCSAGGRNAVLAYGCRQLVGICRHFDRHFKRSRASREEDPEFQLYPGKLIKHMAEQDEQGHCEGITCPSLFDNLAKDRAAAVFSRGVWPRHLAFDVASHVSSGNSARADFPKNPLHSEQWITIRRGNCGPWIAM